MRAAQHFAPPLLFALLGASPLFAADERAPAKDLDEKQIGKLLQEANRTLDQGMPDVAIGKFLDPVIAQYERQYAKETRTIYVTHGMTETMIYMSLATAMATDKDGKGTGGAIAVRSAWTDALEMKAYALVDLKRPDEAKAALERAIQLSPLYPPPWIELGALHQEAKDWPAALGAYKHAEDGAGFMEEGAAKTKELTRAWRGQGFVYTEQGKLDEAEALYRKCLALDAGDRGAQHELDYIASLRAKALPTPPATSTAPDP